MWAGDCCQDHMFQCWEAVWNIGFLWIGPYRSLLCNSSFFERHQFGGRTQGTGASVRCDIGVAQFGHDLSQEFQFRAAKKEGRVAVGKKNFRVIIPLFQQSQRLGAEVIPDIPASVRCQGLVHIWQRKACKLIQQKIESRFDLSGFAVKSFIHQIGLNLIDDNTQDWVCCRCGIVYHKKQDSFGFYKVIQRKGVEGKHGRQLRILVEDYKKAGCRDQD